MKHTTFGLLAWLALGAFAKADESYHWAQYVPGDKYPVLVCALPLPAGTKAGSIADVPPATRFFENAR